MFENVKLDFTAQCDLHVRWEWRDDKTGNAPVCRIFYYSIPEKELFKRGLLLESEIRSYFTESLPFSLFSPDVRPKLEEYAVRNPEISGLVYCKRDMNEKEDRQIPIADALHRSVFLVCMYDDTDFLYRVLAPGGYQQVAFSVVKTGAFAKMLQTLTQKGSDRLAIRLEHKDDRMKVAQIKRGRTTVWSVLPENTDVYYFDKEISPEDIQIYYLSSLIGAPDSGETY